VRPVGQRWRLRGNVDVGRGTARLWNCHALGLEALKMKRNRAFHLSLDFVARIPGGDAPRKIRRVCGEAGLGLLDDDQILHVFKPSLLENAVQRVGRHVVTGLARHSDKSPSSTNLKANLPLVAARNGPFAAWVGPELGPRIPGSCARIAAPGSRGVLGKR